MVEIETEGNSEEGKNNENNSTESAHAREAAAEKTRQEIENSTESNRDKIISDGINEELSPQGSSGKIALSSTTEIAGKDTATTMEKLSSLILDIHTKGLSDGLGGDSSYKIDSGEPIESICEKIGQFMLDTKSSLSGEPGSLERAQLIDKSLTQDSIAKITKATAETIINSMSWSEKIKGQLTSFCDSVKQKLSPTKKISPDRLAQITKDVLANSEIDTDSIDEEIKKQKTEDIAKGKKSLPPEEGTTKKRLELLVSLLVALGSLSAIGYTIYGLVKYCQDHSGCMRVEGTDSGPVSSKVLCGKDTFKPSSCQCAPRCKDKTTQDSCDCSPPEKFGGEPPNTTCVDTGDNYLYYNYRVMGPLDIIPSIANDFITQTSNSLINIMKSIGKYLLIIIAAGLVLYIIYAVVKHFLLDKKHGNSFPVTF